MEGCAWEEGCHGDGRLGILQGGASSGCDGGHLAAVRDVRCGCMHKGRVKEGGAMWPYKRKIIGGGCGCMCICAVQENSREGRCWGFWERWAEMVGGRQLMEGLAVRDKQILGRDGWESDVGSRVEQRQENGAGRQQGLGWPGNSESSWCDLWHEACDNHWPLFGPKFSWYLIFCLNHNLGPSRIFPNTDELTLTLPKCSPTVLWQKSPFFSSHVSWNNYSTNTTAPHLHRGFPSIPLLIAVEHCLQSTVWLIDNRTWTHMVVCHCYLPLCVLLANFSQHEKN